MPVLPPFYSMSKNRSRESSRNDDVSAGSNINTSAIAIRGKRVLVTGASGFIGGRLVEQIVHEYGAIPTILVRRRSLPVRFGPIADKLSVTIGFLDNQDIVDAAVAVCSAVVHCAYDGTDLAANIRGISNIITACISHKVRLVHVSSYAIYLPCAAGELNESSRQPSPESHYALIKAKIEAIILDAVSSRGLDAVIIQPTIVYGPYGGTWTIGPTKQLLAGTVILPDAGEGICNAVFIDDVCHALILAAVCKVRSGRRYLISGPEPVTWRQFYEGYATALSCKGPEYRSFSPQSPEPRASVIDIPPPVKPSIGSRKLASWLRSRIAVRLLPRYGRIYRILGGLQRKKEHPLSLEQVQFYRSKCCVSPVLANDELGYRAKYNLDRGMAVTSVWLHELFGAKKK